MKEVNTVNVKKVYIRKGDSESERIISINFEGEDALLNEWSDFLFDLGWAIDGNSTFKIVKRSNLREEELRLKDWLAKEGFAVEFA